ncbi:hypothetical protein RIR_jg34982.t1 [Rhizophagus irregularis DAOM 181602=DAOM 197198]|nr:hypothetical protein RhiirB3_166256 [Rhizophagus irregularis]GET51820.1 hypothetical protein RIR_jg34982.t1 [Rhizophagus irregularis DAOM 181602=DAOM 197198]
MSGRKVKVKVKVWNCCRGTKKVVKQFCYLTLLNLNPPLLPPNIYIYVVLYWCINLLPFKITCITLLVYNSFQKTYNNHHIQALSLLFFFF